LNMPKIKSDTKYSYADYLQWDDNQKWELIDGVPYNMSPAPNDIHQEVSTNILRLFSNYLVDKKCVVYAAPFDVRLSKKEKDQEIFDVVQPDISIICDRRKLPDGRGCKGAPDLIVEILSPGGTAFKRDRRSKFRLYEQHRVREYWIVDPVHEAIEVYLLRENSFGEQQLYTKGDVIQVSLFEDLQVDLNEVFHLTFAER
jgi:Uma2 family endonuclease